MMNRIIYFIFFVFIQLFLLSCQDNSRFKDTQSNIVLIVIDTLRADHLSSYGYSKETASFLSEIAPQSVLFENAFSTSSWTAPAAASIFTSLDPSQHGVVTGRAAYGRLKEAEECKILLNKIPDEIETLAEFLKACGYKTYAVSDNANICKEMGFSQGFDYFETGWDRGAAKINEILKNCYKEIQMNGKYFLYIHYVDPHMPYGARKPWYQKSSNAEIDAISRYDSEISYVDNKIREIFYHYKWNENTILIITSDHGEEFWDHKNAGHGLTLYNEVIKIPFIFYFPEGSIQPKRISINASLLDILPTIRELIGSPPGSTDLGLSLAEVIVKNNNKKYYKREIFSHLARKKGEFSRNMTMRSLIVDNWKIIKQSQRKNMLFNINDQAEKNNLAEMEPEHFESLNRTLTAATKEMKTYAFEEVIIEIDKTEFEKLESLGYLN